MSKRKVSSGRQRRRRQSSADSCVSRQSNMAGEVTSDEEDTISDTIEWTPENEIRLFNALKNRRPVGLNRNFQMLFISENFNNLMNREVPSSVLWERLSQLYDLETLNENDSPPSSIIDDHDFALPSDFDDLCGKKVSNQPESTPTVSQKGTSLLRPAGSGTPKHKQAKASDSSRKEGRPVKEEDGKGDEVVKVVKKKGRPPMDPALRAANLSASAGKKRRNN